MEMLLATISGILMAVTIVVVAFWMAKQSNRTIWIVIASAASVLATILLLA